MIRSWALALLLALAACGRREEPAVASVVDSGGITVVTIPLPDDTAATLEFVRDSGFAVLGGAGDTLGAVGSIWGAVTLADGRTAVAVTEPPFIRILGADGRSLGEVGVRGEGPGEYPLRPPVLLALGDSLLALRTRAAGRLDLDLRDGRQRLLREWSIVLDSVLSGEGADLLGSIAGGLVFGGSSSGRGRRPGRYRADYLVRVVAAGDTVGRRLLRLDGEPRWRLEGIYVLSAVFGPLTTAAVTGDLITVGTNDGFEVRGWRIDGTVARITRFRARPEPVTDAMREEWQRRSGDIPDPGAKEAMRRFGGWWFADTMRWYDHVYPTNDGSLWIARARRYRDDARAIEVVGPRGRYRGRLVLPARIGIEEIRGDTVLVRDRDPEYGESLGRYLLRAKG